MSQPPDGPLSSQTTANGSQQWSQQTFKLTDTLVLKEEDTNDSQTSIAGPSTAHTPAASMPPPDSAVWTTQPSRPSHLEPEDYETMMLTSARLQATLAADLIAALFPDVDSPFVDAEDVVNRLLPYHIFQHPKRDLEAITRPDRKGKRKATDDDLAREIAETKFALSCTKRFKGLEQRFRRARTKAGKRDAHPEQEALLASLMLESERAETTVIGNELRTARTELDRLEKEKRAAAPPPPRPPATTYQPPTTTAQPQYYRGGYTFTYAQPYTAPPQPPTPVQPMYAPTAYTRVPASGTVPVQVPVGSLELLRQIGIHPVAQAELPPADEPQPAAVLRGTSANGALLDLEVNVGRMGSVQMNALRIVLNLMGKGVPVQGAQAHGAAAGSGSGTSGVPAQGSSGGTGAGGSSS